MASETQWVSVLERMPMDRHKLYLTFNEESGVNINEPGDFSEWLDDMDGSRVLMWRDLPQEPDWKTVAKPILDELDRLQEQEDAALDDEEDEDEFVIDIG